MAKRIRIVVEMATIRERLIARAGTINELILGTDREVEQSISVVDDAVLRLREVLNPHSERVLSKDYDSSRDLPDTKLVDPL